MTFATSVGPGERTLEGLGWLARVGASPIEPLCLVMGWSERVAMDHVRRLVAAGLVTRIAMTRGDGSLIIATRDGCATAGYPRAFALRGLGPTNWRRAVVCAWVCAWMDVRGHDYWSDREIGADPGFWEREVIYRDRRGLKRTPHRPDLGVQLRGERPAAVEVELVDKERARLFGVLRMYEERTSGPDATLSFALYITTQRHVAARVDEVAKQAWIGAPAIAFRSFDVVVDQARESARQRHARPAPAVTEEPPANDPCQTPPDR